MNYMLIAIVFGICLFMSYKNIKNLRKFSHSKGYTKCFNSIISNPDESYQSICEYIEKEDDSIYKNKGLILKLFIELEGQDYQKTLDAIDLKPLMYKKDKFESDEFLFNADSLVWLIVCMTKCQKRKLKKELKQIAELVNIYKADIENYVEYQLFNGVYNCLTKTADYGTKFFNDLLNGDYVNYKYDKHLIGLYKRLAAASLLYLDYEVDEYNRQDLAAFSSSMIGYLYMSDLGIIEKVAAKPQEEN